MTTKEFDEYANIKDAQPITTATRGDKFKHSDGTIIYITYAYYGNLCVTFLDSKGKWDGTQSVRELELLAYLNENNFERIDTWQKIK